MIRKKDANEEWFLLGYDFLLKGAFNVIDFIVWNDVIDSSKFN